MMDAVEYVKQCRRMIANDVQIRSVLGGWSAEAVVEQVEQWAKKHPVKTRQSEFLKQWPDIEISDDGLPSIAPCQLDVGLIHGKAQKDCEDRGVCDKCRHDFWLKEIE